jgi:hypothetical protein
MTWWNVSNRQKKTVEEHELWQKDDMVIRHIVVWRSGSVSVETENDEPPEFDQSDGPSGDAVDMYAIDYEYEFNETIDGCYEDFIWPDEMSEEERERLLELWEEESYNGWEEDGWDQYDTELWFSGPLLIEKQGD